ARLRRVRSVNAAVAVAALALAAAVPGQRPWLVAGGLVWAAAAEAYVRRSSWLKAGQPGRVVRAEIVAALGFAAGVGGVVAADAGPGWIAGLFVGRHVLELLLTGIEPGLVAPTGVASSGVEWVGQV